MRIDHSNLSLAKIYAVLEWQARNKPRKTGEESIIRDAAEALHDAIIWSSMYAGADTEVVLSNIRRVLRDHLRLVKSVDSYAIDLGYQMSYIYLRESRYDDRPIYMIFICLQYRDTDGDRFDITFPTGIWFDFDRHGHVMRITTSPGDMKYPLE